MELRVSENYESMYNRNIIGSYYEIFVYIRKFSGNVGKRLAGLRSRFGES